MVMGISHNSSEELGSWLHEEDFPFLFASDAGNDGATYTAFGGGLRDNNMIDSRAVIVVGPDGRIAGAIESFNQNDPMAYEGLAQIDVLTTPTLPPRRGMAGCHGGTSCPQAPESPGL